MLSQHIKSLSLAIGNCDDVIKSIALVYVHFRWSNEKYGKGADIMGGISYEYNAGFCSILLLALGGMEKESRDSIDDTTGIFP